MLHVNSAKYINTQNKEIAAKNNKLYITKMATV